MNPKKTKANAKVLTEEAVAEAERNDVGSARSNDNAVCADPGPGPGPGPGITYLNTYLKYEIFEYK